MNAGAQTGYSLAVESRHAGRDVVLWTLFFLICLGLGYPTLNRYDPRATGGLSDTQSYYELATDGPSAVSSHIRFRVMVPLLARPLAQLAAGRVGTWEPVFVGFLIVNAFFTATTAYLLVLVARRLVGLDLVALLAAALYLLNFEIANLRLSGLVDSAEGCFLLAITWCLLSRRIWLLPICGVLGALAKESFVPFAMVYTLTWWCVSRQRERWTRVEALTILSTGLAALLSVTIVQAIISGHMVWPWEFGVSLGADEGSVDGLRANVIDRHLLYGFVWLLPLGILRLHRLPRAWTLACTSVAVLAFIMVAWHGAAPGTAARALFTIAGPLLSLSAAIYVSRSPRVVH